MDRVGRLAAQHRGKVTLPPRVRAALWHAYAWGRFRTRKYYWRGRNAALRCWRGWTAAVAGSEAPAPATPSSNAAADPGTPAAAGPDTHDWAAPLLALPGPGYDLLALSGAALLLAGHEHGRHLRGDSLLAALYAHAHRAWARRSLLTTRLRRWGRRAGQHPATQQAIKQLTAAKGLARRAEAAWAAVVDRVSWWWLLLGSGGVKGGGWRGFGGLGGNGEGGGGVLMTLAELEREWAGIAQCPVRRAAGQCGIFHERHAVLFALSASCSHAFCRGCSGHYLQTLLGSGPFPARCPTCRAEDSAPGTVSGLITRSVLKALATEGVATPHHARRFLLQQCRAVEDEATQDVLARTAKRCPNCGQASTHYRSHGCHHIKPGTGCPSCGHHWCFLCLYDSGLTWTGCANQCQLYCSQDCSCPRCPDCLPGLPCEGCDRDCPSCRLVA